MQYRDIIKMCYQAAFGAEHLMKDADAARRYLQKEYESAAVRDAPLYEMISDTVCRVNLSAWKRLSLPLDELFSMFMSSCSVAEDGGELFERYIEEAEEFIKDGEHSLSLDEWRKLLEEYRRMGTHPVHHSEEYRKKELPSYRIVSLELLSSLLKENEKN